MAPHSSTIVWGIPWMEEPGGLRSMVSHRVGHYLATSLLLFTFMHWRRKWQPTPVFLPGESPSGLLSMGSHRVRHDWSDLIASAWYNLEGRIPNPIWNLLNQSLPSNKFPNDLYAPLDFAGGSDDRVCLQYKRLGSIPGSGRSPGEGHGNPLQYSCLEKSHGWRSLAGWSPWLTKSWTWLSN